VVERDYTTSIDRGTAKRIPELILMFITTVLLSALINQISGILDSIGRNEFDYNLPYLAITSFLTVLALTLFWKLAQTIRNVKINALIQVWIDTTQGIIPYLTFKNHDGVSFHYRPQLYLANAFKLMHISLQNIATFEKHGAKVWTDPTVPFEESEREVRVREKIIAFYTDSSTDNPVYELFDRVLTDYLQDARYMAENLGIQEIGYCVTHEWRDKKMGGFNARPATETDPKSVIPVDHSSPILKIEPLYSSDSDSREIYIRIPKGMEISDISSDGFRGFSIIGNGIELKISYLQLRTISLYDSDLTMHSDEDILLLADQIELTTHLKMTILGYLRYRKLFNRIVRWAEEYMHNLTSEFDWFAFKTKNAIDHFEITNLELKVENEEKNDNSERSST
jgi:hypothetical protein